MHRRLTLTDRPVPLLRELWRLDRGTVPLESIRAGLDEASQRAGGVEDDRIWLGRARLALLADQLDDARAWLDRCLSAGPAASETGSGPGSRPPTDAAVWRAWLDWAAEAEQPAEVARALDRLGVARLTPLRVLVVAGLAAAVPRRVRGGAGGPGASPRAGAEPGPPARSAGRAGGGAGGSRGDDRSATGRPPSTGHCSIMIAGSRRLESHPLRRPASTWPGWPRPPGEPTMRSRGFSSRRGKALPGMRSPVLPIGCSGSSLRPPSPRPTTPRLRARGPSLSRLPRPRPPVPAGGAHGESDSPRALPVFADEAAGAGLAFTFLTGATALHQMPEALGGGVGLLDYDGDGWLDVYVRAGGPVPARPAAPRRRPPLPQPRRRHVRGRDGAVRHRPAWGRATATASPWATIDNDGHPDLFVTRWRALRAATATEATGRFEDATGPAGLGGDRGLADVGGVRRPGRRRRPRPLRLPLRRLGRRQPQALPRPADQRLRLLLLRAGSAAVARPRLPQRRRPVRRRDRRGRDRRRRRPRPGRRRRRPR